MIETAKRLSTLILWCAPRLFDYVVVIHYLVQLPDTLSPGQSDYKGTAAGRKSFLRPIFAGATAQHRAFRRNSQRTTRRVIFDADSKDVFLSFFVMNKFDTNVRKAGPKKPI